MITPLKDLQNKNIGYNWLINQGIMQLYPWDIWSSKDEQQHKDIRKEFIKETSEPNDTHVKDFIPFASHDCQDDYAGFIVENGEVTEKVIVVHLTWRGASEFNGYPDTTNYNNIWDWLENRVVDDLEIMNHVAKHHNGMVTQNQHIPIETKLGFLHGRDCIYLNKTEYANNLVLQGEINGDLCSNNNNDSFIPYKITFNNTLAISMTELDSLYDSDTWKGESCFDEVNNSSWIEDLKGKVTSKHRHFSFVAYDDVFEVVCEDYTLELLSP